MGTNQNVTVVKEKWRFVDAFGRTCLLQKFSPPQHQHGKFGLLMNGNEVIK